MGSVLAKFEALDWMCRGDQTRWTRVNRHLWRVKAMYSGGDVFLAQFPGAKAHQRIWNYRPEKVAH